MATAAEALCVMLAVFCYRMCHEKGGNMGCLWRRRRQQRTPGLSVRMKSLSHLCSAAELKNKKQCQFLRVKVATSAE